MEKKYLFATFFCLIMSVIAHADIKIEPSNPATSDNVRITVSGENGIPCFDISSIHEIIGNTVEMTVNIVEDGGLCAQVVTPWSVTKELGPFALGEYEVTANIIGGSLCGSGCIEKKSFIVSPDGTSDCFGDGTIDILSIDPPEGTILEVGKPYTFTILARYGFNVDTPGEIGVSVHDVETQKQLDNQIQNGKVVSSLTGEETVSVSTTISLDDEPVETIGVSVALFPEGISCTKVTDRIQYTTKLPSNCPHDGDIDMDGQITINDVKLVFDFLFNPSSLTPCQQNHADVNCDGEVTIEDVLCLFDTLFGEECICQKTEFINGFSIPEGYSFDINAGVIDIEGDLHNKGDLTLNNGTINLGGDWVNTGKFSSDNGTVSLSSSTQSQSVWTGGVSSSFDTLTITNLDASGVTFKDALDCNVLNVQSGVRKLSFATTGVHTISTDLNILRSPNDMVTLGPVTPSTSWNLDAPSSTNVSGVNVSYSQQVDGKPITAFDSFDGGNNKNWLFKVSQPITILPVLSTSTSLENTLISDFVANKTIGTLPFEVEFEDLSEGNPTKWFWDFGDGGTSIVQNPMHKYLIEGRFPVTLRVSNASWENSITKSNLIMNKAAQPSLFTIKCSGEFQKDASGIDRLVLNSGEEEQCILTLNNVEPGIPVDIITRQSSENIQATNIFPFKGTVDSGGKLEFIITTVNKGIVRIEWAIAGDNSEHDFNEAAYNAGRVGGIVIEVK